MPCDMHSLIADVTIVAENKVLMVRYSDTNKYDHQAGWFLPDDSLQHGEHPDQAIGRILSEQLGLTGPKPVLDHIESFTGNDGSWHLVFHYKLEFESLPPIEFASDIAAAEWFPFDKLPPRAEVAHHGWGLGTIAKIVGRL